jgi:hypothetical protein
MSMPDQITKLGLSHDSSLIVAGDAAGNIAVFSVQNGNLAGNLSLPLAVPSVASAPATRSEPKVAPPEGLPSPASELAAAEEHAGKLAAELAEVRESSTLAEAAVKMAEESLKKLRDSAAKLKSVLASREAAAKEAARDAELLRARARSAAMKADETDPAAARERILRRLTEKRSLLESTTVLAGRIRDAAARSPRDAGLDDAAKVADELRCKLAADIESETAELGRLEGAARTAQK